MPFRGVEHTADLGIEVWASSLGQLFVDAAIGLSDAITDSALLREEGEIPLAAEEPAIDLLLVAWLEELLYRFEIERVLACGGEAKVEQTQQGWRVESTLRGERFDPARHPLRVTVKAITYHGLNVAGAPDGLWRATVLFDI